MWFCNGACVTVGGVWECRNLGMCHLWYLFVFMFLSVYVWYCGFVCLALYVVDFLFSENIGIMGIYIGVCEVNV